MARQVARLGMVSESSLRVLLVLCSERDSVLEDIVAYYGLVGSPALGETARDAAKDLPTRLLHGGGHAAWLEAHGLAETIPMFPLMAQLESELRICRHEVYLFTRQHDPAWLEKAEAHVRKEKAPTPDPARARRRGAADCGRGGGGGRGVAAGAGRGERLRAGAAGHRGPLPRLRAASATGRGLAGTVVAAGRAVGGGHGGAAAGRRRRRRSSGCGATGGGDAQG